MKNKTLKVFESNLKGVRTLALSFCRSLAGLDPISRRVTFQQQALWYDNKLS